MFSCLVVLHYGSVLSLYYKPAVTLYSMCICLCFIRYKKTGNNWKLSDVQSLMTLHFYHCLLALMADIFAKGGNEWFTAVYDYSVRIEFQSRGTLHIHLCAWVKFPKGVECPITHTHSYAGNSCRGPYSEFVMFLHKLLDVSIDLKCGNGLNESLLNYVAGYSSKASDSLAWKSADWTMDLGNNKWLQTYRLLCKRAPLVPEMIMDFTSMTFMKHTYPTDLLYAPLPHYVVSVGDAWLIDGVRKILGKDHRNLYENYLRRSATLGGKHNRSNMTFIAYARRVHYDSATQDVSKYHTKRVRAVNYAFELFDHYVGQFVAMNYSHSILDRNKLCAAPDLVPDNTRFLCGALDSAVRPGCVVHRAMRGRLARVREKASRLLEVEAAAAAGKELPPEPKRDSDSEDDQRCAFPRHVTDDLDLAPMFDDPDSVSVSDSRTTGLNFLHGDMHADLVLQGCKEARLWTFRQRLVAIHLLLEAHAGRLRAYRQDLPEVSMIDPSQWKLKSRATMPARIWSRGQAQLLKLIADSLQVEDANATFQSNETPFSRFIFASGEPGAGKSEAVVYAAYAAAEAGNNVLIGCPTGVLVSGYLDRLPQHARITCETLHSAWSIGRDVDCLDKHNPPSRLRRYEVFIIDEVGFLDDLIGEIVVRAILELPQKPLVVLVGDLKQMQPIRGGRFIKDFVESDDIAKIVMEQHEFARTQDPRLLEFLHTIRTTQPKIPYIKNFFGNHYLGTHLAKAVHACLSLRTRDETPVTWLTCIGKGAMEVNYEYLRQLGYGTAHEMAQQPDAYPGDIDYGALPMIVRSGMWLRLTRNLDKKRGFCNGAMGQVVDVLCSDRHAVVFTMRLTHGAMVIVHPIQQGDQRFLPCVYGYAMTTRKAQGSSMDFVVLYFDLFKAAPRGFGYVGASRARSSDGLFYFGKIRRTDWLPVGGDAIDEQVTRGHDSADSSSDGRAPSYDESDSSSDGSLAEVEEAMLLDLQNDRDVDYGRGDLMRESDSDSASMGDASAECDDSEGCYDDSEDWESYDDDENDTVHAALGGACVPLSDSAAVRALFD